MCSKLASTQARHPRSVDTCCWLMHFVATQPNMAHSLYCIMVTFVCSCDGPQNKRVMVGVDPFRDPSMQGSNAVRMLQAAVHRSKTSTRRLPPRPKPKPGHPEITMVIGKPRPGTAARSAGSHVTYAATSTIAAAHRPMSAPTRDAPLHAPGTRTQGFFSPIGKPKFAHQVKQVCCNDMSRGADV